MRLPALYVHRNQGPGLLGFSGPSNCLMEQAKLLRLIHMQVFALSPVKARRVHTR